MIKEIFIPGRLCLLGEHSDWAATFRRQNSSIEKGYAIIFPTNQGNYAKIKKIEKKVCRFISQNKTEEIDLNPDNLLKIAQSNSFYNYIAGVLYQISLTQKEMFGLEINNYLSNLPLKKGLSSSASICVLVTRAYNQLLELGWTIAQEMELSYLGEITTPSRCGRMDQACAYNKPLLMTFDKEEIETQIIQNKKELFFVIVDLHSKKDTPKILSKLSQGYPFPLNTKDNKKHYVLGIENKEIVLSAMNCLKNGDNEELGRMMKKAQLNFDENLAFYCPEELIAPKLHSIIYEPSIQDLMFGAKGVGSQGDGTAQILAKNKICQKEIIDILENKFDVSCFCLNI